MLFKRDILLSLVIDIVRSLEGGGVNRVLMSRGVLGRVLEPASSIPELKEKVMHNDRKILA
ncbi:hypothetical protein [Rothia aeria]|uniref:hypothetical protein n=1 Tax=Rothia aeria TaxID=172042 RepID=UPI002550C2C3|nr:hypothetical protein [Rothia aeria]MDK7351885.1 hypothetical protein [Rothia aeria]